jgi:hypothetical protein
VNDAYYQVNQASYEGFGEALQCGLEQGWWTIHPSGDPS